MNVDGVFDEIGHFGKYQAFLVFVCIWSMLPIACNISAVIFLGYEETHGCAPPYNIVDNLSFIDDNTSHIQVHKELVTSSCSMYTNDNLILSNESFSRNTTSECQHGYVHNREVFEQTIRTEWDLVCANSHLNSLATAVFCLGMLVGSIFGGSIADKYGRIRTMIFGTVICIAMEISCSFSPNFIIFISLRCFVGTFCVVVQISMATYTVEIVGKKWRSWVGLLVGVFSGLGYMLLSLIAYFSRHWRTIQLALGLVHLPFLLAAPFVPKSPRLLIAHCKLSQAKQVFHKIARLNGRRLTDETWDKMKEEFHRSQERKTFTTLELCRNRSMILLLIMNIVLWFVNGLIFFCLSFNVGHWSGNPFLNNALSGLVEVVACLVIVPIINTIGRRNTIVVSLAIAGCAIALSEVLKLMKDVQGVRIMEVLLLLLGKFTISGSFNLLFLYSAELFPTSMRNTALGVSTVGGRAASIIAPFILETQHTVPWILSVILVIIAFFSAIMALKCPETKGLAMFSTVDEALKHYKKKQSKSSLIGNNNIENFTVSIPENNAQTENLLKQSIL